jgi:hypothetical protein
MENLDITLFDMEEDLYNLSEYTLNLNFDAHYDRKVMNIYHEFNEEYKNIVEVRHNHTRNSIQ